MMQQAGGEQDMRQTMGVTGNSGVRRRADAARGRAPGYALLLAMACAIALGLLPAAVRAERADRDKEANVTADHSTLCLLYTS